MKRHRQWGVLGCAIAASGLSLSPGLAAAAKDETRCGWFDNPSPGNASFYDRDGEWTIAIQGGHQAKGDWPPTFPPAQYVKAGTGSYGRGCACFEASFDAAEHVVVAIKAARSRTLKECRADRKLKEIEGQL
ncbi:DUF4087 domain-containing protein [Methylobacterium sp. SD21]|uniref:DUF4087 domain-containing protein n=1 Tax=Methylobacterium litchii TaxID=3138810 RepID=UPI00313E07A4